MAGYTRQSAADIIPGAEVTAAPLNAEFNQLQSAMHGSTGHNHQGGSGNGPQLSLTAAVTGVLPIANGGTNASTAAAARTSLFGVSTTVDNTLPRFDGTTGSLQTSGIVVSDTDAISGVVGITSTTGTFSGAVSTGALTSTTGTFSGAVSTGALTASSLTLTTDLSVANGGTGASTLTGVVIGNGTSAFTTVAAPTGTIVGTTDTQTLTNKSIVATQLTGTVASARISGSYTGITGVGALAAGSLTSTFGNISIGSSTITTTGAVSIGTLSATTGTFSSTGTFSGAVTADRFISTASSAIFGGNNAADSVLFRPDATSGTNQMTLSSTGALDVASSVTTTQIVSTGALQNSFTGPVSVADGSAGFPGLRFTDDTNTGFYRISENVIGVSTGGTLAATFGATGALTLVAGLTATTGTFSGAVSMTALTCTTISGTTPTFTGTATADRFVSNSGVFSQDAAGSIFLRPDGPSSTTGQTSISSTGDMVVAGTITASSDARFKTDIETLSNGLDKINRLRGVSFSFVEGGKKTIGVIAQEVREVLPELVLENEEGYLSVAYGNIVAVLIEAVKELTEKVEKLEKEVK